MNAPSNFSTLTPNFQTAWDSTSLGWLKKCPVYYKRTAIDGWQSRHQGIHLRFGGLYAAALERYAHSKASGEPHDTAVLRMVRWALENSGEYVFDHDEETHRAYNPVRVGGVLHWQDIETGELCTDFTPTFIPWNPSPDPDANVKNRYTLIRTLVWNADERQTSPFTTVIDATGKPMVERSFNFHFTEIEGEEIALSGHLDEVVESGDDMWVRDDKTTKNALGANYFAQYTPNGQMSLYTVAGKIILDRPVRGVLVKAAQIGVNFSRFQTAQVPRPQAVLDEWMADTRFWIGQAKRFAEADHWPLNDNSCFLCGHKKICAVSPSHREAHLAVDFEKRERWNPLAVRGDI